MLNYKDICAEVGLLAKEVGARLKAFRAKNEVEIEAKGRHDFVTQMDKFSEQLLVDGLSQIVPEAGFIAEESTRTDRGERYNWIVDPIDGTTNFIHRMPPYAISIALMEDNEVVVGVIFELSQEELFTSWKGGGAYLNGQKINVSKAATVEDSLVATGFPYNNFDRLDDYMRALRVFMEQSQGVRRIGSAATDMAYVAAGRFEMFFEYDLKPYDVAAGCLLVTEAGGKISDFSGGNDYIFGREIVAANNAVFAESLDIIKHHMHR